MTANTLAANRMSHLSAPFTDELERLQSDADDIRNCPYIGLVSNQEEKYAIKSFPRIAFIGYKLFEASLTAGSAITDFQSFNQTSMTSHIDEKAHMPIIDVMVKQFV